jgi:bacitracin transport system permease protein
MFLFYLCAAAQGIKSAYSATRLFSETLTYVTYFIVPALFSLLGSYMISREYQDDTMKNNRIVPVDAEKMIFAKLIACLIIGIILFVFLLIFIIISILFIHADQITSNLLLMYLKIYLLHAIGCFIATLPIIVIVPMIKNGCWISVIFAEIYSFSGLVIAGSKYRSFYPITAAFGFSGATATTAIEFLTCCLSMLFSIILAWIIIKFKKSIRSKQ